MEAARVGKPFRAADEAAAHRVCACDGPGHDPLFSGTLRFA